MTVRQWLKEFNEARATISTDESEKSASKQEHASLKRFTESSNRRAYNLAEEDNSLTKTIKRYNCLVIVGKPGVGKTSCVEAVSQSQGFSLQKIDCSQYSSFAEIKKSYSEAVKSQVVDITNSTLNQGNGKINSFFSLSKPAISDQPRRQESKIFILNNIECFLSTKEDSDIVGDRSTLKSMLDFFRASKFPFVIKMSKTSRNMIDNNLIDEFDFIEYTRPCLDQITAHFDMICRIEALDRLPEVRQLARYKDKQSMPDMTYDDLLQDNLNRFELQLSMLSQDTLDCRLAQLPSFNSLRVFTSAFDYNLHGVISQLNYGMQTDCLKGEYLGNSLWSLINRSFVDEYKFKPELTSQQPANKLDASLMAEYPEVLRSMQWTHLKQVGSTCNQMIFAALLKDQPASIRVHSEVEEFLRKRNPMATIDLLNAQEDVYLSEVSDRVRDGFLKKNFRVQDPEYFNFCQILQLHSEKCSTRNFNRLRSQTKG